MAPLAVSIGDPAGIGPEIIVESWARRSEASLAPFFVVGGKGVLEAAARSRRLALDIALIDDPAEVPGLFGRALPVLGREDVAAHPGQPDEMGAALALQSLAEATRCVLLGTASAIVTAPIAKAQLAAVGFEHPGQTEFFAEVCGMEADQAVMMLAGPSLRAVPLTVHCALSEVSGRLSQQLIERRARIVARALATDFGIAAPRLAVCGLNPHAGEGGRFGNEEARIIAPAIETLRGEGFDITGPHPADALFTPRARQTYDAALAMYHDQALVPLKALDFDEGVNVTLGLPIVRTSPDHGTAFDIAGKGLADPGAMIAAIRMAGEIAANRSAHG